MAEPSGSVGKKRSRSEKESSSDEGDCNEAHGLESNLTSSDTLIAFRMMHAQFPKNDKLYSSVKDRTQVDRDLESLKNEKILRVFKLNTGQDDHAIMLVEDYINQINVALKRLVITNQHYYEIFEWFKERVVGFKLDVSIDHQELCMLLAAGGKVKDEDVTLLINAGLITRQMIDPNMYWFAIPNIGSVLKGLSQGMQVMDMCTRAVGKNSFLF